VNAEANDFAQFVEAREGALRRSAWLLTGDWGLARAADQPEDRPEQDKTGDRVDEHHPAPAGTGDRPPRQPGSAHLATTAAPWRPPQSQSAARTISGGRL
jgi:hypothetical protein